MRLYRVTIEAPGALLAFIVLASSHQAARDRAWEAGVTYKNLTGDETVESEQVDGKVFLFDVTPIVEAR